MSLLRNVLKKNSASAAENADNDESTAKPFNPGVPGQSNKRSTSASFRSSAASFLSVASTIQSVLSFTSLMTLGGSRVPKRRKPDWSKLGAPRFYHRDPPPSEVPEGVERLPLEVSSLKPFTSAHAFSAKNKKGKPRLTTVLYSHASPKHIYPLYTDQANITGEVRIFLKKPSDIEVIEVWVIGKMENMLDLMGMPFLRMRCRLWDPSFGDPTSSSTSADPWNSKFPAGTYVFPFTFDALPQDVHIVQPEEVVRKNKGAIRVELPPNVHVTGLGNFTGQIRYMVGVNVIRGGVKELNDYHDFRFAYLSRTRPVPSPKTDFPLLPSREDWPWSREEVGGWVLTPFGGRGLFKKEEVEIEGVLGVQAIPIHAAMPGARVPFELLLWSTNRDALGEMSKPEHITVMFTRANVYGPDVLSPRSKSRVNRMQDLVELGRIEIVQGVNDQDEFDSPKDVPSSSRTSEDKSTILAQEPLIDMYPAGADAVQAKLDAKRTLYTKPHTMGDPSTAEQASTSDTVGTHVDLDDDSDDDDGDADEGQAVAPTDATDLSITEVTAEIASPSLSLDSKIQSLDAPAVHPSRQSPQSPPPPPVSRTKPRPSRTSSLATSFTIVDKEDDDSEILHGDTPPELTEEVEELGEEDMSFPNQGEQGYTVKLKGDVPVERAAFFPSFRYHNMGREYFIRIEIDHPKYSHIKPTGPRKYLVRNTSLDGNRPPRRVHGSHIAGPSSASAFASAMASKSLSDPSPTSGAAASTTTLLPSTSSTVTLVESAGARKTLNPKESPIFTPSSTVQAPVTPARDPFKGTSVLTIRSQDPYVEIGPKAFIRKVSRGAIVTQESEQRPYWQGQRLQAF